MPGCSKPLHVQRVEKAINLNLFLTHYNNKRTLSTSSDDEEHHSNDENFSVLSNLDILNGMFMKSWLIVLKDLFLDPDDLHDGIYFNIDFTDMDRSWLTEVLQEDSVTDDKSMNFMEYKELLKMHKQKKALCHTSEVRYNIIELHIIFCSTF